MRDTAYPECPEFSDWQYAHSAWKIQSSEQENETEK
jgi:hypothetical protein